MWYGDGVCQGDLQSWGAKYGSDRNPGDGRIDNAHVDDHVGSELQVCLMCIHAVGLTEGGGLEHM